MPQSASSTASGCGTAEGIRHEGANTAGQDGPELRDPVGRAKAATAAPGDAAGQQGAHGGAIQDTEAPTEAAQAHRRGQRSEQPSWDASPATGPR